ncbi:MAG: M15 family metallopeptidase [Alistipes onderdonkii]
MMKRLAAFMLLLAEIGGAYAETAMRSGSAHGMPGKGRGSSGGGIHIDRCFASSEIDDALRAYTYKSTGGLHRPPLARYCGCCTATSHETLLGELVCNEAICGDLLDIFRVLYNASYPIERMVLIDEYDAQDGPSMRANNSSAFNFRFVAGTGVLSSHSRGMAVVINPLYNPYVKTNGGRTVVDPAEAAPYADRTRDFPYKIAEDDPCCREFLRHGFTWGGHWKSLKDYQHFEKRR